MKRKQLIVFTLPFFFNANYNQSVDLYFNCICAVLYLNHEGEICQGGRVDSSSCTGTHDERDLRDDS